VSPRQVAQAIGVSESSLKRWCDKGDLLTARTAGGHRRLPVDHVVQFLRQTGHPLIRPELLGLPSNTGQVPTITDRAATQIIEALTAGDEEQCRRIVFNLYLNGGTICEICDRVLAPAFHEIGECWGCNEMEVYQERLACGFCLRILAELRSVIPAPAEDSPLAIGATPQCDPFMLPTAMVELVFRQTGWRAQSLGSRLPFSSLVAAIKELQPQIFWLSVSHIDDQQQFLDEYRWFYRQVCDRAAIIVGGRALTESMRREMEYAAFCDNLKHMEAFIKAWKAPTTPISSPTSRGDQDG